MYKIGSIVKCPGIWLISLNASPLWGRYFTWIVSKLNFQMFYIPLATPLHMGWISRTHRLPISTIQLGVNSHNIILSKNLKTIQWVGRTQVWPLPKQTKMTYCKDSEAARVAVYIRNVLAVSYSEWSGRRLLRC